MLFQRVSLRNGVLSNGNLSNGVLSCGPVRSFMKTLCVLLAILAGEYISYSDFSGGGLFRGAWDLCQGDGVSSFLGGITTGG